MIEIIACIIISLLLFGEFGGFGEIPDINEQNIKGHKKTCLKEIWIKLIK